MPSLRDVLIRSAEAALELQTESGAMPAGHNGPYHDPETPVRNTSHWLVTFLSAEGITSEKRFRTAADQALGYLLSQDARPDGHAFLHRKNKHKDRCNGLVGQAWTIEALAEAVNAGLRTENVRKIAAEVFLQHPFREDLALWRRLEPDGQVLPYDRTFNHQLWFAAAGGLLVDAAGREAVPKVNRRVRQFLNRLPRTIRIYEDGLVRHPLRPKFEIQKRLSLLRPGEWRLLKNDVFSALRPPGSRQQLRSKAVGYHSFNLYGLALLKKAYPDHMVWNHEKIDRALAFLNSKTYRSQIEGNEYGYPYNPPGFENALAIEVLGDGAGVGRWIEGQLDRCYDPESGLMCGCSEDKATEAARVYEGTRVYTMMQRSFF
jgi:hypothetical protein